MAIAALLPLSAMGQSFVVANDDGVEIKYTVTSDSTVMVSQNNYVASRIVVPASVTYEGTEYTVSEVGNYAFARSNNQNNNHLKYLQLPETINKISFSAFMTNSGMDTLRMLATTPPTIVKFSAPSFLQTNGNTFDPVVQVPTGTIGAYHRTWNKNNTEREHRINFWNEDAVALHVFPAGGMDLKIAFRSDLAKVQNSERYEYKPFLATQVYTEEVIDFSRVYNYITPEPFDVYFDGGDTIVLIATNETFDMIDSLFAGWSNGVMDNITELVIDEETSIRAYNASNSEESLDANNATLQYRPSGKVGKLTTPTGSTTATLLKHALWVSGTDNHNDSVRSTYVAASRYNENSLPGPLRLVDGGTTIEVVSSYSRTWKVSRADIDDFIANVGTQGYTIPDNILSWPGNGPQGYAQQLAPYYDANDDGEYNPQCGDYPLIKGDVAIFSIFNDMGNTGYSLDSNGNRLYDYEFGEPVRYDTIWHGSADHRYYNLKPVYNDTTYYKNHMGIEVHSMAYAFDEPADMAMNNTIFVEYQVFNRSNRNYEDAWFSAWSDFELGYANDDYIGCDVQRGMGFVYNGDETDGPGSGSFEGVPPAQSCAILAGGLMEADGTDNAADDSTSSTVNGAGFGNGIVDDERLGMTNSIYFNNSISGINGEPVTYSDYRNYMTSRWKNGEKMKYGGDGVTYGTDTIDALYMYPGASDPMHWGTGGIVPSVYADDWSEASVGNSPDDRRWVSSSGPFTLAAGSSQTFEIAFTTAFGDVDVASSVELLRNHTDDVRRQWLRDTTDSGKPFTYMPYSAPIVGGIGEPSEVPVLQIYPNPVSDMMTINFGIAADRTVELYDMMGQLVLRSQSGAAAMRLDVASLPSGMYILRCNGAIARIIKN